MSIKTWQDHKAYSNQQWTDDECMKAEIDELRAALAERDAELAALKTELLKPKEDYSYQCRSCTHLYTPETANEDCPRCGSNGTAAITAIQEQLK